MIFWRRWWAVFIRRVARLLDAGAEAAYRQALALENPAARPPADAPGGPPEHWLARARPAPPEHWLARVQAEAPHLLEPGGEGLIEPPDMADAPPVPENRAAEAPVQTAQARLPRPLLPAIRRWMRRAPPEAAVIETTAPEAGAAVEVASHPPAAGHPPTIWPSAPAPAKAPEVRRSQDVSPPEIAAAAMVRPPAPLPVEAPRPDAAPASASFVPSAAAQAPPARRVETRALGQTPRPPEVTSAAFEAETPPPVETRQPERPPVPNRAIRTTAPPHPGAAEVGRSEAAPPRTETVFTTPGPERPLVPPPTLSPSTPGAPPLFPAAPGLPRAYPFEAAALPKDLWPPLPETRDDTAADWQRAVREQERRQRLDREQKGDW